MINATSAPKESSLLSGWLKLASSNLLAAGPFLLANILAARSLGLSDFGQIAIVLAYAKVVDGLFNFQSVNVLTRFLTESINDHDTQAFKGLVKAGLLVDGLTALFAFGVAVAGLPLLGALIGLNPETIPFAMMLCLVIPSRILGVTEAVLRNFDRFWAIGFRPVIHSLLVLVGWFFATLTNSGIEVFLLIWLCAEILVNLWYFSHTWRVLRENDIDGVLSAEARGAIAAADGFWRMLFQTNITFGIRLLSQDADIVLAGAILGPGAAGLLRGAKDAAGLFGLAGRPVQQVSSPRIARTAKSKGPRAATEYAAQIAIAVSVPAMGLALLALWWADGALAKIYGTEFQGVGSVAALLILAKALYLGGVTLLPLTIALGNSGDFLRAVVFATLVYFSALIVATPAFGIMGIAIAHICFEISWLLFGWSRVRREMLRAEAAAALNA